jgi:Domain of unknown function (DUF1330)
VLAQAQATRWYDSEAYQKILPLRTNNSTCTLLPIDGVDDDHRATDVLAGANTAG